MSTTLAIDISGIAHQVWHGIEPSTPSLEKKTFRTLFFTELYQAMLETSPDLVLFVMDSRSGYWRHGLYRDTYWGRVQVAVDETGMLWMRHDEKTYAIEQTGAGIFTKQSKNKDEVPQLVWSYLEAASVNPNFENYLEQIKDHFPKYKGGRNKSKWGQVTSKAEWQDAVNEYTREIALALGAGVIQVDKAEADDIMYCLASNKAEKGILFIMSEDSDMDQLQQYPNVTRYKPSSKEFIQVADPLYGIRMKVILGDSGDNVKSVKRWVARKPTKKDPREGSIKPIGVGGAEELLANGGLTKVAEAEGWLEDLNFNTKMIFLGASPEAIKASCLEAAKQAIGSIKKEGRIDSFGLSMDELRVMRSVATVKKLQFSGAGTAEDGE